MVAALAGKVAELAQQNDDLQKRVIELSRTVDGLADQDQHVQFTEANAAVQRALSGASAPSGAHVPSRTRHVVHNRYNSPPVEDSDPIPRGDTPSDKPDTPKTLTTHYVLQAASPDFAILSSGNNNASEVHVGDDVPGYGHVTSITLHGQAWVVQTEHGAIH